MDTMNAVSNDPMLAMMFMAGIARSRRQAERHASHEAKRRAHYRVALTGGGPIERARRVRQMHGGRGLA